MTGTRATNIFRILKAKLKLHKICASWVPHILTEDQNHTRLELARPLLKRYKHSKPRQVSEIVTDDEKSMYSFQPTQNERNMTWVSKDGTRPQIAKRYKTITKVLYTIFFDTRNVVAQVPTASGQSVTGNYYV